MLSVRVNVRRTLITGVVLLAIALAGSVATNAVLNNVLQSQLTTSIPNALVTLSSFVLFNLQILGTVLIATAIVVRLSRPQRADDTRSRRDPQPFYGRPQDVTLTAQ